MEHERCIIACRWFYESSGTETRISECTGRTIKQQYMFTIPRMPVIFIGGIHRSHEYSMVTTRANASMAPVHPVKEEAKALFESMGMDLSTALNVFLRQSILDNGM